MNKQNDVSNIADFKSLVVCLASPTNIKEWSHGEVTKPETINYRTLKPEKDGLFCERIFGPTKDWECYCGKYKRIRYRGIICDKCGVEVTQSRVRRERMGHIVLSAPVAHVWFFKGAPSKLSLLLDISPRDLESVIYFAQYLVIDVDNDKRDKILKNLRDETKNQKSELDKRVKEEIKVEKEELNKKVKEAKPTLSKDTFEVTRSEIELKAKQKISTLEKKLEEEQQRAEDILKALTQIVENIKPLDLLTEDEYLKLSEYNASDFIKVGMGAETLLEVIKRIDLDKLAASLREETQRYTAGQRHIKATKRLRVIEGFRKASIDPTWMITQVLPVIPPDLRPMVQLTGGRFATSDLNDLYRRVINRNNRLKHLIDLGAPEIILRNEKRMLQEAVDTLIDSSQHSSQRTVAITKELRSLSDMLRGKQGRFRQNLLGKRVDYSGRSVIVIGPELNLNQCGLPKEMALEMFKPFVLREVITRGLAPNVKSAKHFLESKPPEVFDILEDITKNHPVLLNRAPTLHKLGIQAFYPVLIEGSAIRIHPCVCAGYNADFDGDQMAVHVPLSKFSKEECVNLMLPSNNLLKPADGSPITVPNKEMALGTYYLTSIDPELEINNQKVFSDSQETIYAYQMNKIKLRQPIKIKIEGKLTETTVGRILFNEILPEKLRFINEPIKAGTIKNLITKALNLFSKEETTKLIDDIKTIGFDAATISGISVSVSDCEMAAGKGELIAEAEKRVVIFEQNYRRGLITLDEKKRLSNEVWIETTEKIADLTWASLKSSNAVKEIIDSGGTRASKDQVKQLAAMRGLVVDPLGKIVELPTKSNFREGLSIFEYVTSTRGSRKGLTDSALKTADAGYLTRRLVDVAHEALIRMEDCEAKEGIEFFAKSDRTSSFESRVIGRFLTKKVIDPKTKKVIIKEGEEVTENNVKKIIESGVEKIEVRSPLTCQAKHGLCAKCYGRDFSSKQLVEIGTPVGIIAAQSIGEPGTQLTMRVRHTGGIVGLDVTQGLPRVEELFEVRMPKLPSPISEISGKVEVVEETDGYKIRVRSIGIKPVEEREYVVPKTAELTIKDGNLVSAGDQLSSGYLDVKEVLSTRGLRGAQIYLIEEVQNVYESQGIPINDKHFEVIVREMSDKVRIESSGDTVFLPGEMVSKIRFEEENAKILAEGGEPATAQVVILGITRAALYTDSWLSAASFQETTKVLTDAASVSANDNLMGMKENVIIGRLIPTSKERAMLEETV